MLTFATLWSVCIDFFTLHVLMLVVFDFDWSLINENSDTFIFEGLDSSNTLLHAIRAHMKQPLEIGDMEPSWTECMDIHVSDNCLVHVLGAFC